MDACAKHPEVCSDLGDFVVQGSTEGGEVYWLYSLGETWKQLLPVTVCPYPKDSGFENGIFYLFRFIFLKFFSHSFHRFIVLNKVFFLSTTI